MKVIDIARKGNVVRFYLGEKTEKWGWTNPDYKVNGKIPDYLKPSDTFYGDDWNDYPWECNAGPVYDRFVKGYKDIAFPFEMVLFEPVGRHGYCRDDIAEGRVPCLLALTPEALNEIGEYEWSDFSDILEKLDSMMEQGTLPNGVRVFWFLDDEEDVQ